VFVTTVVASTLGKIFQPFFDAMAWVIAGFYALIPNYAVAIALLTLAVLAITAPLTVKSTRSMVAMSKLSPAMKELQKKYKNDKVRLNEEMMKLYREHGVSPAAGCVPMLIQFPVFIVLYDVIEGLTNTIKVHGRIVAEPRYVGHGTALYTSLVHHPGVMDSFGVNLADTLFSHLSWPGRIPYIAMVAIAIGLQYFQMRQINKRNQNQLNQQMQAMQKFMPLIFAIIYIRISAGVNVYFIVSSLGRIGLQIFAFRQQPADAQPRVGRLGTAGKEGRPPRKTLMERLAEAQQRALEQQAQQRALLSGSASTGPSPAPRAKGGPTADGGSATSSGRKTAKSSASASGGTGSTAGQGRGRGQGGPESPVKPRQPAPPTRKVRSVSGSSGPQRAAGSTGTARPSRPRAGDDARSTASGSGSANRGASNGSVPGPAGSGPANGAAGRNGRTGSSGVRTPKGSGKGAPRAN
jgi:YidC/Oxa1 family membrane protein insertase